MTSDRPTLAGFSAQYADLDPLPAHRDPAERRIAKLTDLLWRVYEAHRDGASWAVWAELNGEVEAVLGLEAGPS